MEVFSPWEGVLILGQLHFQPFKKVFLRQALFCWLRWPWSQTLALQGNDLVVLYIPPPSTILELNAHTTSEFKNYPFESCSWLSIAVRGKGFACEHGICLQTRTEEQLLCTLQGKQDRQSNSGITTMKKDSIVAEGINLQFPSMHYFMPCEWTQTTLVFVQFEKVILSQWILNLRLGNSL